MADEYLLVLWTALAVIFALFYFWRWRKVQQQTEFIEEQKRAHDEVVRKARIERLRGTKANKSTFGVGGGSETESSVAEASRGTGNDGRLGSNLPKVSSEQSSDKSVRRKHVRNEEDIKKPRLKKFEFMQGTPEEIERNDQTDDSSAEIENQVPADSHVQSKQSCGNECENSQSVVEEVIDYNNENMEFSTLKRIPAPGQHVATGSGKGITFDPESGAPVAHPLKTLEAVLAWRPGFDEFNVAKEPLVVSEALPVCTNQAKTLVCHDMRGGYIEDRFDQGYPSCSCYVIYHWQYIDIFVYFSHHFVTIPPPCWTNAAHTHAVPMLGTLITEWDDGSERCMKILKDRTSLEHFADQLVDIAEYYKFDGWLVNIENPIQPAQVNNLAEFVKYLTNAMHRQVPNSLVIWYDSVTYKGDLKWQDELNANNRIFFDACDGIFLNYNWSEGHLMRSASAAGRQLCNRVYVGVDCFGRGCYGGGGFNSNKAFKVIRNENLSAALFAPGWVMEKLGDENFIANQDKFWNLLSGYCTVHSPITRIPFETSFCRGYGRKVNYDGKVVLSRPWTNLSAQQAQPTYNNAFFNLGGKGGLVINRVDHTLTDAYNGGGCLLVEGHIRSAAEVSKGVVRLYKADLSILSPLLISITFKLESKRGLDVALQLHKDRKPTYVLLCPPPQDTKDVVPEDEESLLNRRLFQRYGIHKSAIQRSSVFTSPIGGDYYELYSPLTGEDHAVIQRAFTGKEELGEGWCTRHYLIAGKNFTGSRILEIRLLCATHSADSSMQEVTDDSFNLFIGEIKILDPQVIKWPINPVTNLRARDVEWKAADHHHALTLTLVWDYPVTEEHVESAAYYNVFEKRAGANQFLGRAFVEAFRVCQLSVPRSCKHVEFVVQTVTRSGLKRALEISSSIKLEWS